VGRIAGYSNFEWDGSSFKTSGISSNIKGITREAVMADDNTVAGYTETREAPYIEGNIIMDEDTSVDDFEALSGKAQVTDARGYGYAIEDAWLSASLVIDHKEGVAPFRLEGLEGSEITP